MITQYIQNKSNQTKNHSTGMENLIFVMFVFFPELKSILRV